MIRIRQRAPWGVLAAVLFLGASTLPVWTQTLGMSPEWAKDGSKTILWGIMMAFALYAIANAISSGEKSDQHRAKTPSPAIIAAHGLAMLVLCLIGLAALVYGLGVLPSDRPPYIPNLAMMATMLSLALVVPTNVQGFFLPVGDERFRQTQHRAMGLTLRVTLAALLIVGAWDHYAPIDLPLIVILWALLTGLVTLYNAALWWFER